MIVTKSERIFISSPYSDGDTLGAAERIANVERSIDLADQIAQRGHVPFVPLLAHFWHERSPHSYQFWMWWCKEWIRQCDAMLYVGGSRGSVVELQFAAGLGLMIYRSVEEIPDLGCK